MVSWKMMHRSELTIEIYSVVTSAISFAMAHRESFPLTR